MQKLFIVLILLCFAPCAMASPDYFLGDEALSITATTGGFASIPAKCSSAMLSVSGDAVRYRLYNSDKSYGAAPTATVGNIMNEGDYLYLSTRDEINRFQAILKTGGSASTILITYFGKP